MDWDKLIKISHFILIIILVVCAGLYGINLMLNMAGAYQCIDDPCGVCEEITGYKYEEGINNLWCEGNDCIKINLSG